MKSSNHLHIVRLMSEFPPPPACLEHLWAEVSHTTLEIPNPAEQVDTFSASGWKQVPRAYTVFRTVFRTLAGGRGSVHTHVLLPSPWFCCLASLSLGWASGHSRGCPDTHTHLSCSQSQHIVFKKQALRKGLFGK